jgi:hypothetical protein
MKERGIALRIIPGRMLRNHIRAEARVADDSSLGEDAIEFFPTLANKRGGLRFFFTPPRLPNYYDVRVARTARSEEEVASARWH